jgi:hypothetical protein
MKGISRIVAISTFVSLSALASADSVRIAALRDDQAPGAPAGAVFFSQGTGTGTFRAPVINNFGQVAFLASLRLGVGGVTADNNKGIWSEGGGTLHLVAREGEQAPGAPAGANFGDLLIPSGITDAGHVAFGGTLQTASGGVALDTDSGVWAGPTGAVGLVAREGAQAPGVPAGASFGSFTDVAGTAFNPILFNNAGQVAFANTLQAGGAVTTANDDGLWTQANGQLALLAREGETAPGMPAGSTFSGPFNSFAFNDNGRSAFHALSNPGLVGGVWAGSVNNLSVRAQRGMQAPGTVMGDVFDEFGRTAFNNSDQSAFVATLTAGAGDVTSDNNSGVWTEAGGTTRLVAREGDPAPGFPSGAVFDDFFNFALPAQGTGAQIKTNSAGQTAFIGKVKPTSGVVLPGLFGLWVDTAGQLELVAHTGLNVDGESQLQSIGEFAFNSAGHVAFIGDLSGISSRGLFAQNPSGELNVIAKVGDQYEMKPGDSQEVLQLFFNTGAGDGDGLGGGYNDVGQVAFSLGFLSGAGVYVHTFVPEPAGLVMMTFFLSVVHARRRL